MNKLDKKQVTQVIDECLIVYLKGICKQLGIEDISENQLDITMLDARLDFRKAIVDIVTLSHHQAVDSMKGKIRRGEGMTVPTITPDEAA